MSHQVIISWLRTSRTPRECVDWNCHSPPLGVSIAIVALPVSAWIEMLYPHNILAVSRSRTPRECVDWNLLTVDFLLSFLCRTPRECVDWNFLCSWIQRRRTASRTPRECVDWNESMYNPHALIGGRTPRGCVDWNRKRSTLPALKESRTPRGCVDWNLKSIFSCKVV